VNGAPRLSVVVPAYNEAARIDAALDRLAAFARSETEAVVRVVLVDDGSTDDTAARIASRIAAWPFARLVSLPRNRGKGAAVQAGVLACAEAEWILMSDVDGSAPLEQWRVLRAALEAGADFACGSRAVPGARIGTPPPRLRRLLGRVFNRLVAVAGVRDIGDTQCGFKLFRGAEARRVFPLLRSLGFAFDVELIALARACGYRVVEVPVAWDYEGHSTVSLFSNGPAMLVDLARIALRRLLRRGGWRKAARDGG